jgi:GNAT superfamily N-acetyltransferase
MIDTSINTPDNGYSEKRMADDFSLSLLSQSMPTPFHYSLRPATSEDPFSMAEVQAQSWNTSYKEFMPKEYLASMYTQQELNRLADEWTRRLDPEEDYDPDNHMYTVAFSDDGEEVVAFSAAFFNLKPDHPTVEFSQELGFKNPANIGALQVNPDHRRQGVGTALIKSIEERVKDKEVDGLFAWIFERSDSSSAKFARNLGFTKTQYTDEQGLPTSPEETTGDEYQVNLYMKDLRPKLT